MIEKLLRLLRLNKQMGIPSSQIIAGWVKETLVSEKWILLKDQCHIALKAKMSGKSFDLIEELTENNLQYVAEHLRDHAAESRQDGVVASFEIDEEQDPYVRSIYRPSDKLLDVLRTIDPFDFEKICALILQKLRAKAETTQRSYDGGVDFLAIDFDFVPDGLETPASCRAAVIGQAKRYKDGNAVTETALRSFIGGAVRWRHKLAAEGKIGALSPVSFAFWTTSSFEPNARLYARAVGVWYMEGRTLAAYCDALGLATQIAAFAPAKGA